MLKSQQKVDIKLSKICQSHQKLPRVTKGRFTLHWNCCEDSRYCRRRFKLFVGLFVDLLDSPVKQLSLRDNRQLNLMTQMLAPANSAWVCWLFWLCWCSENYTVKHKRVFILSGSVWMNCTVMNIRIQFCLFTQQWRRNYRAVYPAAHKACFSFFWFN